MTANGIAANPHMPILRPACISCNTEIPEDEFLNKCGHVFHRTCHGDRFAIYETCPCGARLLGRAEFLHERDKGCMDRCLDRICDVFMRCCGQRLARLLQGLSLKSC